MILSDNEVSLRLESPLNLINKIKKLSNSRETGMELFIPSAFQYFTGDGSDLGRNDESSAVLSDESIQSILASIKDDDSSLDEAMPDNAAKIKLGIVKSKALDVLHDSLEMLGANLSQVSKVEKLSSIAKDMKSILAEDDTTAKHSTNIVVYKPITNEVSKYETIVVGE